MWPKRNRKRLTGTRKLTPRYSVSSTRRYRCWSVQNELPWRYVQLLRLSIFNLFHRSVPRWKMCMPKLCAYLCCLANARAIAARRSPSGRAELDWMDGSWGCDGIFLSRSLISGHRISKQTPSVRESPSDAPSGAATGLVEVVFPLENCPTDPSPPRAVSYRLELGELWPRSSSAFACKKDGIRNSSKKVKYGQGF